MPSPTPPDLHVYEDPEAVARAVARRFVELAREAVESHGRFAVALAGGSTPKRVYELLATEEFSGQVRWERVHLFFGDERAVPPEHPESNFRMARSALLSRVPIPSDNVRRMRGEGDAEDAALAYEGELRAFFADAPWPRFDLVLLGIGDDGHTASLFPHTPALRELTRWAVANPVEKLKTVRLTLTAPAINHAAHVLFIVTGAAKRERLQEVIAGPPDPERLPAQLIRPVRGTLEWFLDRAASPTP